MRTISLYRHGLTMGTAPAKNNHQRAKRDVVQGWSANATRRNIAFLRSINPEHLHVSGDGELLVGVALTLTLRDCPLTHEDWESLRVSFVHRLRRIDLVRFHWVTEWQRRGVPHLHGAFWFPSSGSRNDDLNLLTLIQKHWVELTSAYRTNMTGQHAVFIGDAVGWFQYLAKHAARGLNHYQRSSDSIPAGWEKTGRMWGRGGQWDISEPRRFVTEEKAFFVFRRIARSWRKADARSSGNGFRISKARTMLKNPDKDLSKLRGVSEWISDTESFLILDFIRAMGLMVKEKPKKVEPKNSDSKKTEK